MSRHVAFVLTRLAAGGAETQTRRVACLLAKRGWKVSVVSLITDAVDAPELKKHGVVQYNLGGRRGLLSVASVWGLVALLRDIRPDVLVGLMMPADPLARVAGGLAGIPVVSSIRNQHVGGAAAIWSLRLTDRLVRLLTANAQVTRERLGQRITARPEEIEIVPNALHFDDGAVGAASTSCRAEIRNELGIGETEFLWVAVGAQRPQKNYRVLLRALEAVPEGSLMIAGAAYQQRELEALAKELNIAGRVRLLGRRSDVPALLDAADAFVMASLFEGTPNAMLEAMTYGLPVVATAVGGIPEVVQDGSSGWLVQDASERALADRMRHVMQISNAERVKIAQRGRDLVVERHAPEKVADEWEGLLVRAMADAKAGSA